MKKLLLISVSILLCFVSVFTCGASANLPASYCKTTKINGVKFTYRVIDGKYVEIVRGEGFVPADIEGYPVTKIGEEAYALDEDQAEDPFVLDENWVIPGTVTYIGYRAFRYNYSIETITIPPSVTYIGIAAFQGCRHLKSVKIPSSVEEIPRYAFELCTELEKVELPNTIYEIGGCAFSGCYMLKSINIPQRLSRIGYEAFYSCKRLKKFDFSGRYLLAGCAIGKRAIGFCPRNIQDEEYVIKSKKISGVTIVCEPRMDYDLVEYALKNNFNLVFNRRTKETITDDGKYFKEESKRKDLGFCHAGDTVKIIVDGKKLSDFKAKNSKIIKITKDGKVTGLKKGSTKVTVTLPTGKKYTGEFHVSNDPALKKKAQNGKYKTVKTLSVKQGKTASVKVFGKAPKINNKYTNTKTAKVISKKNASTLKIKGLRPGTTTLKIKVNGVKTIKLKVKVTY